MTARISTGDSCTARMNDIIASPPLEKLDSVWRLFCDSSYTRIDERRDIIIKCTEILKTFKAKEVAALREWALRNVINNRHDALHECIVVIII